MFFKFLANFAKTKVMLARAPENVHFLPPSTFMFKCIVESWYNSVENTKMSQNHHKSFRSVSCVNLANVVLQLQSLLEESQSDASKQCKLRERADVHTKELEQELEILRKKQLSRSPSSTSIAEQQELSRYTHYHSMLVLDFQAFLTSRDAIFRGNYQIFTRLYPEFIRYMYIKK